MTIGVDLGGTNIRAGIESGGNIFDQRKEFVQTGRSLGETLTQFIEFIRPLVSADIKGSVLVSLLLLMLKRESFIMWSTFLHGNVFP